MMSYALPEPPWHLANTPLWAAHFDGLICPRCGEYGFAFHGPAQSPHFATYECQSCGFQPWMPKPRTIAEQKSRRPTRGYDQFDDDRCVHCSGTRAELARLGRQLQDGHIIDRAILIEAGLPPDEPDNHKWICNHCHEDEQVKRRDLRRLLAALRAET